jgi:hypothetical protein
MSKRMQTSDEDFKKIKFGNVPVLLVFTHLDSLRLEAQDEAVREHALKHNDDRIRDISHVPKAHWGTVKQREEAIFQKKITMKKNEWNFPVGTNPFTQTLFISNKPEGTLKNQTR